MANDNHEKWPSVTNDASTASEMDASSVDPISPLPVDQLIPVCFVLDLFDDFF